MNDPFRIIGETVVWIKQYKTARWLKSTYITEIYLRSGRLFTLTPKNVASLILQITDEVTRDLYEYEYDRESTKRAKDIRKQSMEEFGFSEEQIERFEMRYMSDIEEHKYTENVKENFDINLLDYEYNYGGVEVYDGGFLTLPGSSAEMIELIKSGEDFFHQNIKTQLQIKGHGVEQTWDHKEVGDIGPHQKIEIFIAPDILSVPLYKLKKIMSGELLAGFTVEVDKVV